VDGDAAADVEAPAAAAVVAVEDDDFELEQAPATVAASTAGMARRSKREDRNMCRSLLLCRTGVPIRGRSAQNAPGAEGKLRAASVSEMDGT